MRGPDTYTLAVLENGKTTTLPVSGIWPRWSPSGKYILTTDREGLFIVDIHGNVTHRIKIKNNIAYWGWFGSDNKILVSEMTEHPGQDQHIYNLVCYDMVTGERRIITSYERLNTISEISVSPDGTQVTFARYWENVPGPNMNIYLLDLETKEEIEIDTRCTGPRFSQDGSKIIYDKLILDEKGHASPLGSHIMIYDIKTGTKKPIVGRPLSGNHFNLSKDGKTLIFSDDFSLFRLNVETGELIRMLDRPVYRKRVGTVEYIRDRYPDWINP